MMRRFAQAGSVLVVAACAVVFPLVPKPVQSQELQVLQTHIAAPADAKLIGRMPASQTLSLAISLPLRNEEQLDALLQQLYDPASPNYRRFLTVQQFTERFGPTLADYERVIGFAQSHGLKVTHTFANRLVVDVSGTVADVEQAFQVKMQIYRHPTENRTFYAPDVEPTVEVGLPVLSVEGLSTFNLPRPMLKKASPNAGVHSNQTGSGPGGQFLGSDMRTAYGGGTSLNGTGQVVGLIELGPYRLGDVFSYFTSLDQPLNVPIVNVLVGVNGICGVGCDDGEEAIDIQQAISMAPNLSALLVYETNGPSTDALNAYEQAASDNIAKQLSISFGWGGTPSSSPDYEDVFEELAAQGISSFVASGDAGANSGGGGYPGNSPNITDAGGTDLTTASAGGAWQSETGWSGSGGGWNSQSPIPTGAPNFLWDQKTAINTSNNGDPSYRNIPDVSAEANTDNYFCANGSCQGGIGGTSLAAPRWAAFVALINQQAAANATSTGSNSPLGFLNPLIYPIGLGQSSASYANVFHDITSGSNPSDSNPVLTCTYPGYGCLSDGVQGFDAVTGLDFVTGWGTPNGPTAFSALFPATTNPNFTISASPSVLPLTAGGSPGTSQISVTPVNGFNAAANLAVVIPGTGSPSYAPTGLSATLTGTTLNVSTTSSTPGGTYVIAVVGTSGTAPNVLTQTAYVTVELPAFVGVSAAPAGISVNQSGSATATVTATTINGFTGTIGLAASGLPSGVTAGFSGSSPTFSATFTATSTATLTEANQPAAVTITGTASGSSPQTTGINVFTNPPTSGGAGTQVDLPYNVYAFYDDADESSITATNSLDGVGSAYSANLLGSGLDFNGTQFNYGPANQLDAVYGTPGAAITLPGGYYTNLEMLATGIEGNQASQTVTVTYTDSTSSTFTQSFSDWCSALNGNGCVSTGSNPGESVAVAMPYRDTAGGPDNRVFYLYHYSFALNTNKSVQSLTLPNNRDVVVLAATLSGPVTTGFTLAAAPNPISVAQSGNNTTTITATPTGGFSGTVSLSASGLPSGVTAAFNPASTATTSTLTLTASATAATGQTAVTITGTSGNLIQNTTVNLTVTPPASYSLAAGTATQGTISPGGSSQATVTVTSANGYTGSVTLSCAIAPVVTPAPTCSFGSTSPVTVSSSGGSATVTFTTVGSSAELLRRGSAFYALLLPIPGLALVGAGFGSLSRKKKLLSILLLWIALAGAFIMPACSSSSNGGGGSGSSGTPAGSYTITITGKDANGVTQTGAAPTVTVTVN